jgi:hypothetical protein
MKRAALLLALGACADPVVDMSLKLPTAQQMPADFDLSCITAVEVYAVGNERGSQATPPDVVGDCIDLPAAPSSFADIRAAIAGKFDLTIPQSGLAGVQVRGTVGACAEATRYHEANFYGGAVYLEGSDSLAIPVVPNISCSAKTIYQVSTIDMLALDKTKQCAMSLPDPTAQPLVFAGDIRPQLLGASFDRMVWESGQSAMPPDAAGKATISSFTGAAAQRSCIALGYDSAKSLAGSCINPGTPTLCAAPGELELAVIDNFYAFGSIDTALVQQYGPPVFGAVYKKAPPTIAYHTAIAGATVELEDPAQGKVIYVMPGANKLLPIGGATATDSSGMFIVYLKGDASSITVKAGGASQRYTVASHNTAPPTLLAVFP